MVTFLSLVGLGWGRHWSPATLVSRRFGRVRRLTTLSGARIRT